MAALGFYLSGGSNNSDPTLSLGGPPSVVAIEDVLNNLFDDVTGDQVADGRTDYRCFYVVNDTADTYLDLKLWIEAEYPGGASVELGVSPNDEVQLIELTGSPVGGSFRLTLDGYETTDIAYTANPTDLAANVETALRGLPNATEVTVEALTTDTVRATFGGVNSNHKYPLLSLSANNFDPTSADATITESVAGSPINLEAPDIESATTAPTGVLFTSPTESLPLTIGQINPTEVFPVWIKRITDPETDPVALDGVQIKMQADLLLS
jgi:hypothetical protein